MQTDLAALLERITAISPLADAFVTEALLAQAERIAADPPSAAACRLAIQIGAAVEEMDGAVTLLEG